MSAHSIAVPMCETANFYFNEGRSSMRNLPDSVAEITFKF